MTKREPEITMVTEIVNSTQRDTTKTMAWKLLVECVHQTIVAVTFQSLKARSPRTTARREPLGACEFEVS